MRNLEKLFAPRSIAIVGASPKQGKLGNVLAENIRRGGWRGKLYFVNPKYSKSRSGYFASLGEIGKSVDLTLVAIPAPLVGEVLGQGAKSSPAVKNFAVISSGFKEIGNEGKEFEANMVKLAKKYKLNILGPNCLGFANPYENLNATFTDVKLQKGHIAIVSQSGALAVALLDWASGKNIGFSKIISIGNKAVLDESAILEHLANDKGTKAIALYLEDVKNGQAFLSALSKITPRKPVAILKAGRTAAGRKAVSSHTGSLAQDQDVVDAVFEKMNVVPADNIEEFQSLVFYLNSNPVPEKNEVIVLTNAGGPGVMASDFVGKSKNIRLLNFSPDFKQTLKKDLPASASVENPIDVIGDAPPGRYQKVLEKIARKFPGNPVVVILTPQNQTDPARVAQILVKMKKRIPNLSACFMGGEKIAAAKAILQKNNIPNFHRPEKALSVIEKLVKYSQELNSWKIPRVELLENPETGVIIRNAIIANRQMLSWSEAEKLFGKYGIRLAKSISFKNPIDLKSKKISYPVALKTDDPAIAHRLEKNAVMLNIQNEKELRSAFEKMSAKAKHFLIQPMAEPGLELIIGMKRDPSFGPVILAGWGGSFTELFRDKTILIPPFGRNEIRNRLSQLKIFPVLKGYRGKRGYNLEEISNIVAAVAQIAVENPEIHEIDINPLVVYNNGKRGQILDAKLFLR